MFNSIANILSFIGLLSYHIGTNTKIKLISFTLFSSIAYVICGAYAAAIMNVAILIFALAVQGKLDKKQTASTGLSLLLDFIMICLIIISIFINDKGVIGYFPIVGKIGYVIYSLTNIFKSKIFKSKSTLTILTENTFAMGIILLLDGSLLLVHDIAIMLVPATIYDIGTIITALGALAFANSKKKETNREDNQKENQTEKFTNEEIFLSKYKGRTITESIKTNHQAKIDSHGELQNRRGESMNND